MVATFLLEISMMVYVIVRYRLNPFGRLVASMLFFLALFQLAEYNVCTGSSSGAQTWSQVGFISITMLPPIGIHLVQAISKRGWQAITWLAYGNALIWVLLFMFGPNLFQGHVCQGNYVIFQLNAAMGYFYYMYYYAWLFIAIFMSVYFIRRAKRHIWEALLLFALGYLVFIVPTIILNTVKPSTTAGIPSIMCGFAVIFAIILTFGILPILSASTTKLKAGKKVKKRMR